MFHSHNLMIIFVIRHGIFPRAERLQHHEHVSTGMPLKNSVQLDHTTDHHAINEGRVFVKLDETRIES